MRGQFRPYSMPFPRAATRRGALELLFGSACAGSVIFSWGRVQARDASADAVADPAALNRDIAFDGAARVTVPIFIDGKGPFIFILDTASERTVIASELAEYLQLESGPAVQVHTVSGRVTSGTVLLPKFEIEGRRLAPKAAPHFTRRNIGAMGIVGLDVLRSQRVVLDFRRSAMMINAEPVVAQDWSGETILVTAQSKLGQLVMTNAGIGSDDESIWVVIDTGAQFSIGNEALRQFLLRGGRLGDRQTMDLISVTGDSMPADYTVVQQLRIGGLTISNLPVAFANAHPFRQFGLVRQRALLLGMDVLRRFDQIGLNFAKRTVRFFWS